MADIVRRSEREPARWREWDPFEQLERAFTPLAGRGAFTPTFDVRETADAYVFKADLPGMKEDDLDINLTGNRLTISGLRQEEERHEGETYYTVERSYGSFSRTFTIPEGCDLEHIEADLKNGVLTVLVPKHEHVKPKRISLKGMKEGVKGGVETLKGKVEKVAEKLKS